MDGKEKIGPHRFYVNVVYHDYGFHYAHQYIWASDRKTALQKLQDKLDIKSRDLEAYNVICAIAILVNRNVGDMQTIMLLNVIMRHAKRPQKKEKNTQNCVS